MASPEVVTVGKLSKVRDANKVLSSSVSTRSFRSGRVPGLWDQPRFRRLCAFLDHHMRNSFSFVFPGRMASAVGAELLPSRFFSQNSLAVTRQKPRDRRNIGIRPEATRRLTNGEVVARILLPPLLWEVPSWTWVKKATACS